MTNFLTDEELIDRVIKFSDDPEKVRLATYMERIKGSIMDDLLDAGMDDTYCTFRTEWGSEKLPGQYIMHLEEELKLRDERILELQEELEERKTLTVSALISELHSKINTLDWTARDAHKEKVKAEQERDHAKEQLKMWNHLRTP